MNDIERSILQDSYSKYECYFNEYNNNAKHRLRALLIEEAVRKNWDLLKIKFIDNEYNTRNK